MTFTARKAPITLRASQTSPYAPRPMGRSSVWSGISGGTFTLHSRNSNGGWPASKTSFHFPSQLLHLGLEHPSQSVPRQIDLREADVEFLCHLHQRQITRGGQSENEQLLGAHLGSYPTKRPAQKILFPLALPHFVQGIPCWIGHLFQHRLAFVSVAGKRFAH